MGQILHSCATTTHATRAKIQQELGTINSIAKKFNIDRSTVKKWQNRDSVEDKPMGNGRANSNLTLDEDWLICEVRRLTWLPLDDLHQILLPMFPKLSRSALPCTAYYNTMALVKNPKNCNKNPFVQSLSRMR
jgi:hypothetical protein